VDEFLKAFGTGLAAIVIGLIAVFSDKLIGRIRLALNRADMRVEQYEKMALTLGEFVFLVQLEYEYRYNRWDAPGKDPSWTLIDDQYKDAINKVRKNEFVYRSWVNKYWDKNQLQEFDRIMKLIIENVDPAIHALKDENEQRDDVLKKLEESSVDLRNRVKEWLVKSEA